MLSFDLFWSFRSPYSYLVTDRIVAFRNEYDVQCNVRPVYPIAVRQPEFFANSDPLWFSYFARDIHRSAQFLEIPFRWANGCADADLSVGAAIYLSPDPAGNGGGGAGQGPRVH